MRITLELSAHHLFKEQTVEPLIASVDHLEGTTQKNDCSQLSIVSLDGESQRQRVLERARRASYSDRVSPGHGSWLGLVHDAGSTGARGHQHRGCHYHAQE
jgi:hypothetical protein